MTAEWTSSDQKIEGVSRGTTFEAILPNFATAGYRWQAYFDAGKFELISVDPSGASNNGMAFCFLALGDGGQIRFELARSGQPPQEIRIYTVYVEGG